MSYINLAFQKVVHVPQGEVVRTAHVGIERDSRMTVLDAGFSMPPARAGRIPGVDRFVKLDPMNPKVAPHAAAVRDAWQGAGWVQSLDVDVPRTGPTTYEWTMLGGTTERSTTPPASITALVAALESVTGFAV